jgi:hypothetical protein
MRIALVALVLLLQAREKSYRLPSTDLKQQVLWGSTCDVAEGVSVAFGGEDQKAADGNPHTRIQVGKGPWMAIHPELRSRNPTQALRERCWEVRNRLKDVTARCRTEYFKGGATVPPEGEVRKGLEGVLQDAPEGPGKALLLRARASLADVPVELSASSIRARSAVQILLEQAAEAFDAEPPPRALSPLVYDATAKLVVVFGGDHLDYLTNDTWTFDPVKKVWSLRHPKEAPPPRANHQLTAIDGKIVLRGGYTYTSTTDYVGGQYRDLTDGEWTYDPATDVWTGGKGVPPETRVYRTGRLHPDTYLEGPKPDPASFAEWLKTLPANSWAKTKPPHLPALNRDWGTAVLDPDHHLILRWSGGHSAHGGTDVLEYHLDTNRWELCYPVEFPLGQLYSNTEYPEGVNFNQRPWVTGHTYQNYGYDPMLKKMLFTGRQVDCFMYDPAVGDWTGRLGKPRGMAYGSCFYTLTVTSTPEGLICWTQDGRLFRFEEEAWKDRELRGEKLAGSVVDNSTVLYDSKRARLLFARKTYGEKSVFSGELQAVDLKTWVVSTLSPSGKEAAGLVPYLCQIRYDSESDLCLAGCTMAPGGDGIRRTPAYDPAGNRWISLRISGDDPSGPTGRNVSLGLMYDAARKIFWAVDTNSQVYVLRLDPKSADLQPM